jgi:DNA-directed RNA polymerase subunit RPC12/RpoP
MFCEHGHESMPKKVTRCEDCGYRVRWNPETREGPTVFFERGVCPSCGESFEDRAPVSARRGQKRR